MTHTYPTSLINPNSIVGHSDSFICERIDGEVVMISIEKGTYFALDEVGSIIWDQIERPTQVVTLCHSLVALSDATYAQCEQDLLEFLSELSNEGMIFVH